MRLVFYSGGYADDNQILDQKLLKLTSKKDIVLTVIPACSYLSDQYYQDLVEQYSKLGVKKILQFNIDQKYSQVMKKAIFKSDIIHLGGGNTFYFLKHLRRNGFLQELKQWTLAGGILTGLSAGAIIMTKSINTASFPDFDKDENEENIKNLKGMNLVDFEIFPHYRNSKRYESALLDYSRKSSLPLYALADGSGIIYLDDEIRFVGKAVCFHQGRKYLIHK